MLFNGKSHQIFVQGSHWGEKLFSSCMEFTCLAGHVWKILEMSVKGVPDKLSRQRKTCRKCQRHLIWQKSFARHFVQWATKCFLCFELQYFNSLHEILDHCKTLDDVLNITWNDYAKVVQLWQNIIVGISLRQTLTSFRDKNKELDPWKYVLLFVYQWNMCLLDHTWDYWLTWNIIIIHRLSDIVVLLLWCRLKNGHKWFVTFYLLIVRKMMDQLKADRPHPHDYPQTPTDYRHTDNHLRLVMVVVALCCTRQTGELWQTNTRRDRRTDATKYIISLLCGR